MLSSNDNTTNFDTLIQSDLKFVFKEKDFKKYMYPFGRCMNLGPDIRSLNETVDRVEFYIESEKEMSSSNLQVFFNDPLIGDALYTLPSDIITGQFVLTNRSNRSLTAKM